VPDQPPTSPLPDEELRLWLALSLTPGLGLTGAHRLLARFGSPKAVFAASEDELRAAGDLRRAARQGILRRVAFDSAMRELARCRRRGVHVLPLTDPRYPALLREIADPPLVLFVLGEPEVLQRPALAVVGSRAASPYGRQVAEQYGGALAGVGLVVVSGMALGIDGAAHRGCLGAGGTTVAVLGCGVDVVYPYQHRNLYRQIASTGVLVSEYPLGTRPEGFRFPARNRIISGLSLGVLVVEAAARSGAMITVEFALEQGREVFAIPGRIDSPKSAGTHRIVQQGGKLVTCIEDILEELPRWAVAPGAAEGPEAPAGEKATSTLAGDGQIVYSCLDVYPRDIDTIIRAAGLPAARVAELLLLLELDGLVESLPGNLYRNHTDG